MTSEEMTQKRKRRSITLEDKLAIVKRYEKGEKTKDIRLATGINESTLRAIREKADEIKETGKSANLKIIGRVCRSRPAIMTRMEEVLAPWLELQIQYNHSFSVKLIKDEAKRIYETLRKDEPGVKPFSASKGWFRKFRNRHKFINLKLTHEAPDETVSSDETNDENVEHLLASFRQELITEEDSVVLNSRKSEEELKGKGDVQKLPKILKINEMVEAFRHLVNYMTYITENDPNEERRSLVPGILKSVNSFYEEILKVMFENSVLLNIQNSVEHMEVELKCKEGIKEEHKVRKFTISGMEEAFRHFESFVSYFIENDPNVNRSMMVSNIMRSVNSCYEDILQEMRQKQY